MSLNEQIRPSGQDLSDAVATAAESVSPQASVQSTAHDLAAGLDDILDDIDTVLESNAAAFVQGFVQKGGE